MFSLGSELLELIALLMFTASASIMFLAYAAAALRRETRSSSNTKELKVKQESPQVHQVAPRTAAVHLGTQVAPSMETGSPVKTRGLQPIVNPPVNTIDPRRTIKLEVEFPELPETIKIPLEKLPKILELLREEGALASQVNHKFVVQESREKRSASFAGHPDRPWLDILSRVSGLEFSGDGERVRCPRHGWVPYIVTSDGRILCGEGNEILWDPNKERYRPPDKRELLRMQKELESISREVRELQAMAEMRPPQPTRTRAEEEEEELEEEGEYEEEEPGEPEEEA